MAKWKELGEVPDSDDESDFDSQESQVQEDELPHIDLLQPEVDENDDAPAAHEASQAAPQAGYDDVWDIPRSSPSPRPDQVTQEVSVVSSSLEPPPDSTPPWPHSSPPMPTVDKPRGGITIELPPPPPGNHVRIDEEGEEPNSPSTADIDRLFTNPESAVENVSGEALLPTQDLVRYSRSLRPRKPIQEHPYLLESAQYSKLFKSHGVRPVRVQIEEAARKRQEEDSQEQDYEEDSQSTAKDHGFEESGESQAIIRSDPLDPLDDLDELALSPPEKAPSCSHVLAVNQPRSSQDDDEEFPDLADVAKWKMLSTTRKTGKRHASPKTSTKRKVPRRSEQDTSTNVASPLRRPVDIFDIPPSPPQTSPRIFSTTPLPNLNSSRFAPALTPKPSSATPSLNQSPAPASRSSRVVDLTLPDDQGSGSDEGDGGNNNNSEDETDVLLRNSRRIRGVLPASWLRLDQQTGRQAMKRPNPRQSLDRSPEKSHRKGVAQRRQVSPRPTMENPFFFDDSDDDGGNEPNLRLNDIDDLPNDPTIPIFDDDAGSVIEENHIDHMLPARKRSVDGPDGPARPRKKRKHQQTTFRGHPDQRKRQQRITGHLSRTKTSSAGHSRRGHNAPTRHLKDHSMASIRPHTPPRLSIIDVAEPAAPAFIRIAARTARRRPDKGRASPSSKRISLGTRQDHREATEVLTDWKKGKIQPRLPVNAVVTQHQENRSPPLRPVSHNPIQSRPRPGKPRVRKVIPSSRFSQPARPGKQASLDNFVSVETETENGILPQESDSIRTPGLNSWSGAPSRRQDVEPTARPAQLETAGEIVGRYAFTTRKKALDALYRRSRKALPAPTNVRLDKVVLSNGKVTEPNQLDADTQTSDDLLFLEFCEAQGEAVVPEPVTKATRLKSRKRTKPQHLDTSAPQYAHANDPLPREPSPVVEVHDVPENNTKLLGLGPFGTHYTQHFEVFPLDQGVFFHETTLLGSGRVTKALESAIDELDQSRGRSVFVVDEKNLQWGSWDAQTSSEFGIVCDWIADHLGPNLGPDQSPRQAVRAALFVLDYLQNSLSFPDQESQTAFAHRALEVLQSYSQRLGAIPTDSDQLLQPTVQVLSCCLLTVAQALRICQKMDMLSESFKFEELLKDVAKHISRRLLKTDLADIRSLYDDLQRSSYQERGIRDDQHTTVCWVVLIRVLEGVQIPRSGFWDIVSPIMLGGDVASVTDARAFERMWHNLFTLLPLGEFDNSGILIPGIRSSLPLESWWLPQQLVNRIFQLYKSNPRQSPSFNDYCRGVVGRCHYLAEHWGWRKCNGIIGTIFDFFASQDLSHLRNEEAYRSPQFLDDLATSPSLAIVPEDRCFHIFLKLLALSIKRLRKFGLIKDVRNLITRVLPNHDRQYIKEKDMHETELAALRNHHDLLCTLFWAAPPDLRPSIQLIEKLVVPGSSHKEACLVNLRAWNQLARFLVSSGEEISSAVYRPFADWQKNVFQQVLTQYQSAESDMQQQLLRLSKDASRGISQTIMDSVVKANKKASMDVLHYSMKAVLDVMRHTRSLDSTSLVLQQYQLDQIFVSFSSATAESDWSTLRVAVDMVDYYSRRTEEALSRQQDQSAARQGEDAVLFLDRYIVSPFFSMARAIIRTDFKLSARSHIMDRVICLEEIVLVAGRVAARLVHARLAGVSKFFSSGKSSLFDELPKNLAGPSRKFLPLFLATMVDKGVSDLKNLGVTTLELFLTAVTKPFQFLGYENRLAEALKRHGDPYLADAFIDVGRSPDYSSNRDLFSHTISRMRRTLRSAEPSQRQQLQPLFTKCLQAVMEQMKQDLKLMVSSPPEHANYIDFVRSIVGLIRAQDICRVDSYFYQIGPEYSPSRQDPRLQTAGILACGLKLEEGSPYAASSLFYLLWPNFTTALANGKLADERAILEQGMLHPHVFLFMLGKMLPAIVQTAVRKAEGWTLAETYVGAFENWLGRSAVHRELGDEAMDGVLTLLKSAAASLRHLQTLEREDLRTEHVYTLIQSLKLLNLLAPSLRAFLINDDGASQTADAIIEVIDPITGFTQRAEAYLYTLVEYREKAARKVAGGSKSLRGASPQIPPLTIDPARIFDGVPLRPSQQHQSQPDGRDEKLVGDFVTHMVREIDNAWVTVQSGAGVILTVKGPARPPASSTQPSGPGGTPVPSWDPGTLIEQLLEQARAWNYAFGDGETQSITANGGGGGGGGGWEGRWLDGNNGLIGWF